MKRFLLASLLLGFVFVGVKAQYSLSATTYSQDFNGLGTATSTGVTGGDLSIVSATLTGWYFSESGTSANTTITAGTGSSGTGDTYNFGAAAGANRTLGGLQSGTLIPSYGFYFINNTGGTIQSLTITYTGETWRVGTASRPDEIDFQYSTDATSLTTGTWTSFSGLNYANPGQATGSGSVQHSSSISNTITGLSIANGATFFIRWTDFNASGADDGMGINDFSLTATLAPTNTITTGTVSSPPFVLANCGVTATGTVDFTSTDVFNGGNTFTAQLSDDIGSFASPANIGSISLSGNGPSGTINITIPAGTVGGTGYKIRVVSDNPSVTGTLSSAFTITQQGLGGCSSSHTDYYRSVQTGNWGVLSTWESSPDNSNWISATLVPTNYANNITIQNGHTVTVAAAASADQVIISNGATLKHSSGIFTIEDGPSNDIDIQSGGILELASASNPPTYGVGSPAINVSTGGTVKVSATGLTAAGAGVNANNFVYNHQSILEFTLTSAFSSSGVTYFPNATAATIPIFRTTNSGAITVGAASATTINGVFECNGADISWQSAGVKTFRNGIRGSGNIIALGTSGKFVINGVTAELGGAGSLILPTGGLEIGSTLNATTVSLISNKTVTGDVALLSTNNTYVDLGNNNFTFASGTVTSAGVNAYFKTSGTGVLTMPPLLPSTTSVFHIGNSSYNPLTITNNEISAISFSTRVEDAINPATALPIYATRGIQRTWSITASATASPIVTFQYNTADFGTDITPSDLVEILGNTGSPWNIAPSQINLSQTAIGGGIYTTQSVSPGLATGTSTLKYIIGKNGGWILPIDCVIALKAQKRNNSGIISWNVNSCSEVTSFELQRSVNGGAYQTIQTVRPSGTETDFSFTDAQLAKGRNLYRVKVNGLSGSVKYSGTVALIYDSNDILITSLSPNPASTTATLTISTASVQPASFIIYNNSGAIVKKWSTVLTEGNNNIPIDVEGLPAGTYHIMAATAGNKSVSSFIKQ